MSLRLTWNSVLAIACCAAVTGCAPFKPWAGSKANPSGKTAPRTAAPAQENLEHLLDDEPTKAPRPKPEKAKTAARPATKSGNFFSGDTTKKDAARKVDIDSELAMARLGERRGQSDNAKQMYKQITEKYPEHPGAFHRLGVLHAQDGNFQQAHACFEQAVEIGSPSVDLLSDLGYCYYLQSRYEDAEKVLRQGHKLKPNHESTCNNLGLVLGAQNRYAESLEMFQRVNSEAEAYANLAYVFSLQGDLKNAKQGYVEALTADKTLRPAAKALIQVDERLKQHERQAAVAKQKQSESGVPAASAHPKQASSGRSEAGLARSAPAANRPAVVADETSEPMPAFVRRSQPVEVIELPSPPMPTRAIRSADEADKVAETDEQDAPEANSIENEMPAELPAPRTNVVRRDEQTTRPQAGLPHSAPVETEEALRDTTERPMYAMPKPALNRRPSSVAIAPPAESPPTSSDDNDPPPSIAPVKPTIVPPVAVKSESSVADKKEAITNPFINPKPASKLAHTDIKPSMPAPAAIVPTPITSGTAKPSRTSSFVPPERLATPSKNLDKAVLPEAATMPEPKAMSTRPTATVESSAIASLKPSNTATTSPRNMAMNSPWEKPSAVKPSELLPSEPKPDPAATRKPSVSSELTGLDPIGRPAAMKPETKPQSSMTMKFGAAKTPPSSQPKRKPASPAQSSAPTIASNSPVTAPSFAPPVAPPSALPVDLGPSASDSEPKSAMVINPTFTPSKTTAAARKPERIESREKPSQLATLGSSINTGASAPSKPVRPSAAVTKSPATPREELAQPTLPPIVAAPRALPSDKPVRSTQVAMADRSEIQIAELPPIINAKDFAAPTPKTAKFGAQPANKAANPTSQLANAHSRTGLGSWVTTSAKSRNVEDDLDLPPVVTPAQLAPRRPSR